MSNWLDNLDPSLRELEALDPGMPDERQRCAKGLEDSDYCQAMAQTTGRRCTIRALKGRTNCHMHDAEYIAAREAKKPNRDEGVFGLSTSDKSPRKRPAKLRRWSKKDAAEAAARYELAAFNAYMDDEEVSAADVAEYFDSLAWYWSYWLNEQTNRQQEPVGVPTMAKKLRSEMYRLWDARIHSLRVELTLAAVLNDLVARVMNSHPNPGGYIYLAIGDLVTAEIEKLGA